jgi:predicted DNA-binding transcriptional regulator AlpA
MRDTVDFKWISEATGLPLSSVYHYNRTGEGPRSFKVGRRYWVTRLDYEEWLSATRGNQ